MKIKHKFIIPFIVMGGIYLVIELVFRASMGSLVGINDFKYLSMIGYTSFWMFLVGGLFGVLIGQLNERPSFYTKKIIYQCIIGTLIVLSFELVSGILFNIILDLNLWTYSDTPFNILGQICLLFGIAWFLLMPFGSLCSNWEFLSVSSGC